MPTKAKDQLALDEKVITDQDLEDALDEREKAHNAFAAARIAFNRVDQEAKGRVEALDLGLDTAVRVGRFRITKTMTKSRTVDSFQTQAKEKIDISTVDEE